MFQVIDMPFKYKLSLEYDPYEEINKEKYDQTVIFSCTSLLSAAKERTWDEIVKFFFRDISGLNRTELQEKRETIKRETEDQWNKIVFYIADVKYPFLGCMLPGLSKKNSTQEEKRSIDQG